MPFLPFIPFLNCADVVLRFTQQTSTWFLTLGFQFSGPITLLDLQNLHALVDSWWTNSLSFEISAGVTLNSMKYTDLTTAVGPVFVGTPATQALGQLAGAVLPAQTAMVVSFATALRGRSYRGRNYVAGRVTGDQQTVTQWTVGRANSMLAAYLQIPIVIGPGGWTHCVLSRQLNGVRRTVGAPTPVTTYVAKTQVASQRGRLL